MNDLYFEIMQSYYYDATEYGYFKVDNELILAYYEDTAHN